MLMSFSYEHAHTIFVPLTETSLKHKTLGTPIRIQSYLYNCFYINTLMCILCNLIALFVIKKTHRCMQYLKTLSFFGRRQTLSTCLKLVFFNIFADKLRAVVK